MAKGTSKAPEVPPDESPLYREMLLTAKVVDVLRVAIETAGETVGNAIEAAGERIGSALDALAAAVERGDD